MPQSSRVMVTLRACRSQRTLSDWACSAAQGRLIASEARINLFIMSLRSPVVIPRAQRACRDLLSRSGAKPRVMDARSRHSCARLRRAPGSCGMTWKLRLGPLRRCRTLGLGAGDLGGLDVVELREVSLQIRIPERLDHVLIRRLTVVGIQRVDDAHPLDDPAERREAHRVEAPVVHEVDEELVRA